MYISYQCQPIKQQLLLLQCPVKPADTLPFNGMILLLHIEIKLANKYLLLLYSCIYMPSFYHIYLLHLHILT